jgi:hypothetical protein
MADKTVKLSRKWPSDRRQRIEMCELLLLPRSVGSRRLPGTGIAEIQRFINGGIQ